MGRQKQIIITIAVSILIVVIIVVCVTQIGRGDKDDVIPVPEPWKEPRLPQNIRPSNYQVDLDVYLNKGVYSGKVKINVSIYENATNILRVHKVGYNITHTSIRSIDNGSDVKIARTFNYLIYEFWVIETDTALQPGKYEISLSFDSVLSDELNGFYKGNYKDNGGQTRRFAATFFSPISARKAFPCFDEPSFKAVFELMLTHEPGYKALANMPESSSKTLANNRIQTKFLPSLNTSTYIVAWVITDFHSLSFTDSKLDLKGWTPLNNNVTELEYGLNITAVLLPQYEKYFKIDFPLKKLDVVTLPAFAPSAMENWGLIMFRNSKFLTSKTSTYSDKKEVARIQGHELVHQWFGNLATMKFWNEAWLKEGQ